MANPALDLDESTTGVRIQALLEAPGAPTEGVTVYWGGATLPQPLPNTFIVIEPLFPTEWRAGARATNATHTVQVRACARSRGGASSLRATISKLLPRTEFGTVRYGPTIKVDKHFDSILTVTTVTATKKEE